MPARRSLPLAPGFGRPPDGSLALLSVRGACKGNPVPPSRNPYWNTSAKQPVPPPLLLGRRGQEPSRMFPAPL